MITARCLTKFAASSLKQAITTSAGQSFLVTKEHMVLTKPLSVAQAAELGIWIEADAEKGCQVYLRWSFADGFVVIDFENGDADYICSEMSDVDPEAEREYHAAVARAWNALTAQFAG